LLSLSKQNTPLAALGEESESLSRGGIAHRYADNFGRDRSLLNGGERSESGITSVRQVCFSLF
jgi:hypothetical protein